MLSGLQGEDDPVLLGRVAPAKQVTAFHPGAQGVVIHLGYLFAGQKTGHWDSQLGADIAGALSLSPVTILMVTPTCWSAASGEAALSLGGEKGGKTGQHPFCFIADQGMRVVEGDWLPGDAEETKSFRFQRMVLSLEVGVHADSELATSKMMTRGFLKRERYCNSRAFFFCS